MFASRRPATLRALTLTCALSASAAAQATEATRLTTRPGGSVVLPPAAPCVRPVVPPPGGAVEVAKASDARSYAIYRAPEDQREAVPVTIATGSAPNADSTACQGEVQRHFSIATDRTPEIPEDALAKAFRILMAAFVLALLLESAFTLLFNWRLFQEFLVGKAWRTPIMFVGALLVVRAFNLDLVASLLDAYNPRTGGAGSDGGWFTSILTAMILAGGTVGVNRLLVGLGFRSEVRDVPQEPKPNEKQAFVAVRLLGFKTSTDAHVGFVAGDPAKAVPTFGMMRRRPLRDRLGTLFFRRELRVPPSGGITVEADKPYRIIVTAVDAQGTESLRDAFGRSIAKHDDAVTLQFGPRAIVDFDIVVP